MGKHDASPTIGWTISSRIMRWLAGIFIALLVVVAIIVFSIRAIIAHDCDDYYKRDLRVPNHWIHIEVGSTKPECPAPHNNNM